MTEEGWVRDKLFSHAAELGAQRARQDATISEVARIASAMERGFSDQRKMIAESMRSVQEGFAREGAHVRGEIARLDELFRQQRQVDEEDRHRRAIEERRRTDELIASLRETAERAEAAASKVKQLNRRIIFVVVLIGALASTFIENAPNLFSFAVRFFDGIN